MKDKYRITSRTRLEPGSRIKSPVMKGRVTKKAREKYYGDGCSIFIFKSPKLTSSGHVKGHFAKFKIYLPSFGAYFGESGTYKLTCAGRDTSQNKSFFSGYKNTWRHWNDNQKDLLDSLLDIAAGEYERLWEIQKKQFSDNPSVYEDALKYYKQLTNKKQLKNIVNMVRLHFIPVTSGIFLSFYNRKGSKDNNDIFFTAVCLKDISNNSRFPVPALWLILADDWEYNNDNRYFKLVGSINMKADNPCAKDVLYNCVRCYDRNGKICHWIKEDSEKIGKRIYQNPKKFVFLTESKKLTKSGHIKGHISKYQLYLPSFGDYFGGTGKYKVTLGYEETGRGEFFTGYKYTWGYWKKNQEKLLDNFLDIAAGEYEYLWKMKKSSFASDPIVYEKAQKYYKQLIDKKQLKNIVDIGRIHFIPLPSAIVAGINYTKYGVGYYTAVCLKDKTQNSDFPIPVLWMIFANRNVYYDEEGERNKPLVLVGSFNEDENNRSAGSYFHSYLSEEYAWEGQVKHWIRQDVKEIYKKTEFMLERTIILAQFGSCFGGAGSYKVTAGHKGIKHTEELLQAYDKTYEYWKNNEAELLDNILTFAANEYYQMYEVVKTTLDFHKQDEALRYYEPLMDKEQLKKYIDIQKIHFIPILYGDICYTGVCVDGVKSCKKYNVSGLWLILEGNRLAASRRYYADNKHFNTNYYIHCYDDAGEYIAAGKPDLWWERYRKTLEEQKNEIPHHLGRGGSLTKFKKLAPFLYNMSLDTATPDTKEDYFLPRATHPIGEYNSCVFFFQKIKDRKWENCPVFFEDFEISECVPIAENLLDLLRLAVMSKSFMSVAAAANLSKEEYKEYLEKCPCETDVSEEIKVIEENFDLPQIDDVYTYVNNLQKNEEYVKMGEDTLFRIYKKMGLEEEYFLD